MPLLLFSGSNGLKEAVSRIRCQENLHQQCELMMCLLATKYISVKATREVQVPVLFAPQEENPKFQQNKQFENPKFPDIKQRHKQASNRYFVSDTRSWGSTFTIDTESLVVTSCSCVFIELAFFFEMIATSG